MKLLLTGPPGIGKTTVIRTVLSGIKIKAGGFYTQEMRRGGRRVGFDMKTLDGEKRVLAHIDKRGEYRVGRYGVDLDRFEAMAPWITRIFIRIPHLFVSPVRIV